MKTVVIGESSGASIETIMTVYPRHKAVVDTFVNRREVIGIGPFADRDNMAIFRTRRQPTLLLNKTRLSWRAW